MQFSFFEYLFIFTCNRYKEIRSASLVFTDLSWNFLFYMSSILFGWHRSFDFWVALIPLILQYLILALSRLTLYSYFFGLMVRTRRSLWILLSVEARRCCQTIATTVLSHFVTVILHNCMWLWYSYLNLIRHLLVCSSPFLFNHPYTSLLS